MAGVQNATLAAVETKEKGFESEEMRKSMLTTELKTGYAESLKTSSAAFAPRQSVFFIPIILWGMRAENNQYQPKPSELAFSESPANSFFGGLLKKVQKMTNTIIQNLINILETELGSIYRSARVKPATNDSMDSYFALSDKQKNRIKSLCRRHLVLQTRLNQIVGE